MIKINNLSFNYKKDKKILHNINLKIKKETITGLIGSNESGKSTLLKTISKIYKLSNENNGSIEIMDENIMNINYRQLSTLVGFLDQGNSITNIVYESIKVEKFIAFGKYNRKGLFDKYDEEDLLEVKNIMIELKIEHLYGEEIDKLSGGELQKVFITKVLLQDTPIILFDEPFNNLDITFQNDLISIIKKLREKGKTVIIAMHEIDIAINECDAIVLLENGTIKYEGAKDDFIYKVINKKIDSDLLKFEIFKYDEKWYIKKYF